VTTNSIREDEENKRPSDNRQNCGSCDSTWAANPFSLPSPDYAHSAQALYISWNSADAPGFGSRDFDVHDISKRWSEFPAARKVIYPRDIGALQDQPQSNVSEHADLARWAGCFSGFVKYIPVSDSSFPDSQFPDHPA